MEISYLDLMNKVTITFVGSSTEDEGNINEINRLVAEEGYKIIAWDYQIKHIDGQAVTLFNFRLEKQAN